jgi:hypothetical protein
MPGDGRGILQEAAKAGSGRLGIDKHDCDACPNTATASTALAIEAAAGRQMVLLARSAGVHVDFHADRHFHDLRSFPSHSGSPKY